MCQRYRIFKGNSGAEGELSQSLWCQSVIILYIRLDTEPEHPYPQTATKNATSVWTFAWEFFIAKARTIIWTFREQNTQYLQQIKLCSGSRTTIDKLCMTMILSFIIYLHIYTPFNKLIHPSLQIFVYYKKNQEVRYCRNFKALGF